MPHPHLPAHKGRPQDLGTLLARVEAWDEPAIAEPALSDSHGAFLVVVAGCRLALAHPIDLPDAFDA